MTSTLDDPFPSPPRNPAAYKTHVTSATPKNVPKIALPASLALALARSFCALAAASRFHFYASRPVALTAASLDENASLNHPIGSGANFFTLSAKIPAPSAI